MEITDIKRGILWKHLRIQQHGGYTKPQRNDKFVWKIMTSSYHMEQKHSLKQVISMMYTLEKDFFAAATFKGLWDILFKQSKKVCSILWSVWAFFAFIEKKRPNRYYLWEENLVLNM